jgi:uncharacterized SAM-binding protein YcdF (DUF218 family)
MLIENSRDAITQLVFVSHQPAKVDIALVLGCPSISNILPAISLYLAGNAKHIVISGHGPNYQSTPEWRIYNDYAIAAGVPAADILIEPDARNTLENFVLSAKLIERDIGWSSVKLIAICCKPLHTRRALMTARQHFPKHVHLLMNPPNHPDDIQADDWWNDVHGRNRVMGEVLRIGQYAQKGDISID